MSFLRVRDLGLRYAGVAALDGVTLSVERGARLAVVGPSGSGKSTLLRVLAGFAAPDAGEVWLDDQVLVRGAAVVPAHRRGIGLVAQEGALFPHLTVAENIGFGIGRREDGRAARVAELAAMVGLDAAMLRRRPDALSGGQQQRVALARALACRPRLMLLDEPFSALDTALRADTRRAVVALLRQTGVTSVLVTHDQEEALCFADQVAVLRDGRLLQAGTPRELYLRPGSEAVAGLLGAAIVLPGLVQGGVARCALGTVAMPGWADGPVRVMLRPEQVSLTDGEGDGVAGVVAEAEFGGGSCVVTVALADGKRVTWRAAQNAVPAVGNPVRVRVVGVGHGL